MIDKIDEVRYTQGGNKVMEESMSRILVGSVVKKALNDIGDSPRRGIRNLVDMGLEFAEGQFQRKFFQTIQTMLQNAHSAYYRLVQDTVACVDIDKLFTFGMNLGYNGCTVGAQRIRENEKILGIAIPWTICFEIKERRLKENEEQYHALISEGEKLGIYTWMFFIAEKPQAAFPLVREHPDSAFVMFCQSKEVTTACMDDMAKLNNLMLVIRHDERAEEVCRSLRERRLLYSLWYQYGQEDAETILSGAYFCSAQRLSPAFTALLPKPDCSETIQQRIHQNIVQSRTEQKYSTLLWELRRDNRSINEIISGYPHNVCFNADGDLCWWNGEVKEAKKNLFWDGLSEILASACPDDFIEIS